MGSAKGTIKKVLENNNRHAENKDAGKGTHNMCRGRSKTITKEQQRDGPIARGDGCLWVSHHLPYQEQADQPRWHFLSLRNLMLVG